MNTSVYKLIGYWVLSQNNNNNKTNTIIKQNIKKKLYILWENMYPMRMDTDSSEVSSVTGTAAEFSNKHILYKC